MNRSVHYQLMRHTEINYKLAFLLWESATLTNEEICKSLGITKRTWDMWVKRGRHNVKYTNYMEFKDAEKND